MKTLFKIMRSIITSLLFFVLVLIITAQFTFTAFNRDIVKVRNLIDEDYILERIKSDLGEGTLNENLERLVHDYIEGYADYVFSKRSYPSIQTLDTKNLSEEEKALAENVLLELQKKIDLKYETVINLRDTSNFITNGSIYLLVNICVILTFLILSISMMNFKNSTFLLGIAISLSGLISLITSSILFSRISKLQNPILRLFASSVFRNSIVSSIYRRAVIYILIGVLIFFTIFMIEKILKKRQIATK